MDKLRVFTAFSGYDSQCMALDRLGINYELVGWSEIDKYAIRAHNAIYPQWADRNFGDIATIDWYDVPDFDLFTYSFPCTDISCAGRQKGLVEGSGTRSSLLWECRKAIEIKRPKYLLMENVKALTFKKFKPYLLEWEKYIGGLGYTNFTKVLNAKDFGVPQNRERTFMVSVLGDAQYEFPQPFELRVRLKDVLEREVDEKYYLSDKLIKYFTNRNEIANSKGDGFKFEPTGGDAIAHAITTLAGTRPTDNYILEPKIVQVANILEDKNFSNPQVGRIYSPNGLSPTLSTMQGGGREPKMLVTKGDSFRIRKLTPRECFRLMGVSDLDIDKMQSVGISNSQQYKMAGNSIVVDVLFYIFENLFFKQHKM